jgi:hypothetical protein
MISVRYFLAGGSTPALIRARALTNLLANLADAASFGSMLESRGTFTVCGLAVGPLTAVADSVAEVAFSSAKSRRDAPRSELEPPPILADDPLADGSARAEPRALGVDDGDERPLVLPANPLWPLGGVTRVPSFPVKGLTFPFVLQLLEKFPSGLERS